MMREQAVVGEYYVGQLSMQTVHNQDRRREKNFRSKENFETLD